VFAEALGVAGGVGRRAVLLVATVAVLSALWAISLWWALGQ
jgi:hypothetical protein